MKIAPLLSSAIAWLAPLAMWIMFFSPVIRTGLFSISTFESGKKPKTPSVFYDRGSDTPHKVLEWKFCVLTLKHPHP